MSSVQQFQLKFKIFNGKNQKVAKILSIISSFYDYYSCYYFVNKLSLLFCVLCIKMISPVFIEWHQNYAIVIVLHFLRENKCEKFAKIHTSL